MSNEMISVPRDVAEILANGDLLKQPVSDAREQLRALLAKPAEQHQGEPVYMVRTHGSCCWEEVASGSLEDFQSMPEEYDLRALYTHPAEQPAPAAVVLPERDRSGFSDEFSQGSKSGWNACLDEVARLNQVTKS